MIRTISRILVAVLLVAAFASVGYAQGRRGGGQPAQDQEWRGKGRITGKVLDEAGKGVRDAIVLLRHAELMAGPNVKTNRSGEFDARDLKAGEWLIRAQVEGYLVEQQSVMVPESGRAGPLEITLEVDRTAEQFAELQDALAEGDELFKAGQFAAARAEYEKVLTARPDVVAIHRSIAYTYGREGDHAKALEHMEIFIESEPANVEILQLATASALELKDADRAMDYLGKIGDDQVMDPDIFVNFAITMINKAFNPQAITLLDRVVTKFPGAPMPYYLRGMAKLRMSNNGGGKADLQKFVEIAPPDSAQLQQAKDILAKIG